MQMEQHCVLLIYLSNVHSNSLYTDLRDTCHSAKQGPESHRADTVQHPEDRTRDHWTRGFEKNSTGT